MKGTPIHTLAVASGQKFDGRRPRKVRRPRADRYEVNHPMTSGGPKFSSLSEALRYIAHAIQNGNASMTISNL
jgi:hypothetical protein